MCYHYIRECVDEGRIIINYTTTEEQLADILTKALGRVRFLELRDKIGIKFVGDRGQIRERNVVISSHDPQKNLIYFLSLANNRTRLLSFISQ
jgi:hypothetical protein